MAEKRSLIAFEHGREGTQRFEYFLVGVSAALCTYVGQTLQPQRLGFSPYTVEVGALVVLIASVVVGFKRIEALILVAELNHDVLHYGEVRGTLMEARGRDWINVQSGTVYTPQQTEQELKKINQILPARQKQLETTHTTTTHTTAGRYYKLRNWLLAIGFVTLLLSKILTPYFPQH
jgi:hypothetical protein